jgi:hypothetical protein
MLIRQQYTSFSFYEIIYSDFDSLLQNDYQFLNLLFFKILQVVVYQKLIKWTFDR